MTKFDSSYHTGYHLMPASVDAQSNGEMLAMKYEKNPRSKWFTREMRDSVTKFYYPDRTLLRSTYGVLKSGIFDVAPDSVFDYAVLTNPKVYADLGYRYAMISPPHMGYRKVPLRNPHLRLFADSGGFQIRQGVTDFVDPDTLIDFYNESTDVGIGLDVPMHPLLYDDFLARMAHVASRNNKYIKAGLNEHVSLYDLNHGMDIKDRKVFLDVTEQYEPNDGIALAGTSSKARGEYGVSAHIVNGVVGIAYVLARSKGRYKTAHILGTTTPFYMFVFHYMTKVGFFPHITSDSSTYAQAAMMNTQMTSVPGHSVLYRNTLPKGDVLWQTPCPCPICSLAKYSHHLVVNARANIVHGLYHFAYLDAIISTATEDFIAGRMKMSELEKLISPPTFNHQHFKGLMAFLQDLGTMPFGKAYKKNERFIDAMLGKNTKKSLFGGKGKKAAAAPHEDRVRTDKVLASYEKWQKKKGIK
jgi:hypothetical protein